MFLLYLFTLCLYQVNGFSCNTKSDCVSVTTNVNFVDCNNNLCECAKDRGFVGNATVESKCDCPDPSDIEIKNSVQYCINIEDALSWKAEMEREELLKSRVKFIYTSLIWPGASQLSIKIATGNYTGGLFDIFHPQVKGRVEPLGTFVGPDGTTEYFVGSVWTGRSQVYGANFDKLEAVGNKVFINIDIYFKYFSDMSQPPYQYNLTQTGFFVFDDDNLITSLDLVIRDVQWSVGPFNRPTAQWYQTLCHVVVNVAKCGPEQDPEGHFTDFNDCLTYMQSIPFGTWDFVRANTAICRQYHSTLAMLRPHLHCPHAGKTGGGKCVDKPHYKYYDDTY